MAHFAQLDKNNVVLQVIAVHNNELLDENGQENESKGIAFCHSLFGLDSVWCQTSYNGNFRKNYAGIGYTYDQNRDAFIPPQLYPSWTLNEATCNWEAPVPMPNDGNSYTWDESTLSWVIIPTTQEQI